MIVDYKEHYGENYWNGRQIYRTADGKKHLYHGPSLTWEDGFSIVTEALSPLIPGKSILDVGCSAGSLASEFQKRGYDAWGVDISDHAVKNAVASMKGQIALADISTAPELVPFEGDKQFPEKYDVVMATDLLEHLYEEDLEKTFNWMVEKSKRWLFFCVATCHDPAHGPPSLRHATEFVHQKGVEVPLQWEATAAAGHVNVRSYRYWVNYFREWRGQAEYASNGEICRLAPRLTIRWDLMYLLQMHREFNTQFLATLGWHHGNTYILQK